MHASGGSCGSLGNLSTKLVRTRDRTAGCRMSVSLAVTSQSSGFYTPARGEATSFLRDAPSQVESCSPRNSFTSELEREEDAGRLSFVRAAGANKTTLERRPAFFPTKTWFSFF